VRGQNPGIDHRDYLAGTDAWIGNERAVEVIRQVLPARIREVLHRADLVEDHGRHLRIGSERVEVSDGRRAGHDPAAVDHSADAGECIGLAGRFAIRDDDARRARHRHGGIDGPIDRRPWLGDEGLRSGLYRRNGRGDDNEGDTKHNEETARGH
jgi:hypothetical protein